MLEQFLPQDNILRKIYKYIDFSFSRELTYDLSQVLINHFFT